MAIYTGKSRDGSDMRAAEGVYTNPDNPDEWSSKPYPSQTKQIRVENEILEYASGKFSLNDLHQQILDKVCPLPVRCRKYVLNMYKQK